ncbi:hypothetical protein Trydic_g5659 [Trypoxylus dichotomus]
MSLAITISSTSRYNEETSSPGALWRTNLAAKTSSDAWDETPAKGWGWESCGEMIKGSLAKGIKPSLSARYKVFKYLVRWHISYSSSAARYIQWGCKSSVLVKIMSKDPLRC